MTPPRQARMPAAFIGHGSPMNAIEDNEWHRGWRALGAQLPRPRSILCISAHWETAGVRVTSAASPATIHDFGGFPRELHEVQYPAPGSPDLARRVAGLLEERAVMLDPERGLDHGCWSVLRAMYPKADVPVVQLSLDRGASPAAHHATGAKLAPLRDEGVLILGSGNVVHNLGRIDWGSERGHDWAQRFDDWVGERIAAGDDRALFGYEQAPDARLAVPTPEHFQPLFYVLGARAPGDRVVRVQEGVVFGSISMASVVVGAGGEPVRAPSNIAPE